MRFYTYFLFTRTNAIYSFALFLCCDVNDSLIDVQIFSYAIYHGKRPTINLCGKWKALIFFHCISLLYTQTFSVCTLAKHCDLIFLYFFICNAGNLLISTTYGMALKIYHLHFEAKNGERASERVREKSSQTHFSDRILNYVLMNTTASDFVLHAADSIFWIFSISFWISNTSYSECATLNIFFGFVSFLFCSSLRCSLVNFKFSVLSFRLLSTTVFSLLKILTVYFFGFSHQRAHYRCSIDSVRNCSVFTCLSLSHFHTRLLCHAFEIYRVAVPFLRFRDFGSDLNRKIVIFNIITTDPSQPIRLYVWTRNTHTIYSNFLCYVSDVSPNAHTSHWKPYGLDLVQSRNFSIFCLYFDFDIGTDCVRGISIFSLSFFRAKIPMCISTEHCSVFIFYWWCVNVALA